ncbi:MAG: SAM-dependent methyltransferase [Sulfuricaulis sp.]|uniref:class I SAM-dependent methyltransferase n=1 Tax=Sulfuricaulis sp. TaxID=2003553 RepID=UPI0025FC3EDA|nr:SAM-dependent methyltransferase [Sulfuricaulis sp.]MCR4346383.1 SAM-dependent methyltransferase [Sulfuricaulis sp.]
MNSSPHNGQSKKPESPGLPLLTAEEQAQHDKITQRLREEIAAAGGEISFDHFMELALYAPGLGYYAAGKTKFGKQGDFVTAPELGPLFARCLARPCQALLRQLGGGDILEVGAGSGVLAADLLLDLESLGQLPKHYLILELSADLRAHQIETIRQKAPHLFGRISWLAELPDKFRGMVVANELLDAMPVTRFKVTETDISELYVGWENEHFVWREKPASASVRARVEPLGLAAGYTSEINLCAEAWVRSIADILKQGTMLLIDYGFPRSEFYHPQRSQGTLMCHYRHQAHDDPLRLVGLQDITTHVDFSAIAEAATGAGLALAGYTSQAAFLLSSGMEQIMGASDPNDTRAHLTLTQQVKKLTLPHEMGELYKVIALARGVRESLPGFTLQDRRGRL